MKDITNNASTYSTHSSAVQANMTSEEPATDAPGAIAPGTQVCFMQALMNAL
jgi:hypothetical protein